MYRRRYCLKRRFSLILNSLSVSLYLFNDSRYGVVGPSTVCTVCLTYTLEVYVIIIIIVFISTQDKKYISYVTMFE